MAEDVRGELADAIMEIYGDASAEQLADALLPVVDRIARERAAEELRAVSADLDDGEGFADRRAVDIAAWLKRRARDLGTEAGR